MNLENFKIAKLIQEDSFQRFSTGYLRSNPIEVNLISIKNPASILSSTRLLIAEQLYNVLEVFEEHNELHIALTKPKGVPLERYLAEQDFLYDQRIYLGFSLLKALNKYDSFSNSIKYQLLSDEQLFVDEDVICFKEIVDYTTTLHQSFKDVIFRIGRLLEKILASANKNHIQYVDNLLIGNHPYYNLNDLLKDYKDIFIYEKPSSIAQIPREYHITLTQKDEQAFEELPKVEIPVKRYNCIPEMSHEAVISPITDEPKIISTSKEYHPDPFEVLSKDEDPFLESDLLSSELSQLLFSQTIVPQLSNAKMTSELELDMDATFAEAKKAHVQSLQYTQIKNDTQPLKSNDPINFTQYLEHDEALDTHLDELFIEVPKKTMTFTKIIFSFVAFLSVALILYFGSKIIWGPSGELRANYEIDVLKDNRVAFVNTSPNIKKIDHSEWTVYYNDQLISTYESEHFYPIFDTEGKYTVVLRVMDAEGNWSKEFKKDYVYTLSD